MKLHLTLFVKVWFHKQGNDVHDTLMPNREQASTLKRMAAT